MNETYYLCKSFVEASVEKEKVDIKDLFLTIVKTDGSINNVTPTAEEDICLLLSIILENNKNKKDTTEIRLNKFDDDSSIRTINKIEIK